MQTQSLEIKYVVVYGCVRCVCVARQITKFKHIDKKKSATATPTHNRRYIKNISHQQQQQKNEEAKKWTRFSYYTINGWKYERINISVCDCCGRFFFSLVLGYCCVVGGGTANGMRSESEKSQNEWASSILKTLIFIELSIGVDRIRLRNIFWRIMLSIQITKASAWADNVSVRKVFFFFCSLICPNPLSFFSRFLVG